MKINTRLLAAVILTVCSVCFSQAVRSMLYPENWNGSAPTRVPSAGNPDRFLHDFSYAGYMMGEQNIPNIPNTTTAGVVRVYNVRNAPFNANNTGSIDARLAIQQAIDSAANFARNNAGQWGVVYLPAGTYNVSIPGAANEWGRRGLHIWHERVILRGDGVGQTFIRGITRNTRGSVLIAVGNGGQWGGNLLSSRLAANIGYDGTVASGYPTREIRVQSVSGFNVGDWIMIRNDRTQGWINAHSMSALWSPNTDVGNGAGFFRRITAINTASNTITIDIPTRYWMHMNDNARVNRVNPGIQNVALENFSIGNLQNERTNGWGGTDFNVSGTGAFEIHGSFVIRFTGVVNGWARNIHSYNPGNTNDRHMTSNGFDIGQSARLTIDNLRFSRPQYVGEGGNGYGFDISGADNLIINSQSTHTRHAWAFKHGFTNGNVIHNFRSEHTTLPSDFHMYLSMSNLIDNQTVNNDYLESRVRPYGSETNRHGQTSSQTVFWNTNGERGRGGTNNTARTVDSRQHGWGYVIGTRGAATEVTTSLTIYPASSLYNTAPEDHREHIGTGHNLVPQSLWRDQVQRRLHSVARDSTPIVIPATFAATRLIGKSPEVAENAGHIGNMTTNSYVDYRINVPSAGTYAIVLSVAQGNNSARTITVSTGTTSANLTQRTQVSVPGGSDWFNFSPAVQANVNLTAGVQILRLQTNGSVNIESITIGTPVNIPGNFFATQTINRSTGVNSTPGNYVGNLQAGSFGEYLINVTAAGEYRLSFETATGNNNFQRSLTISARGDSVGVLHVINGTDWEAFSQTATRVILTAGVQILRWQATGAVNIREISIAQQPTGDTVVVLEPAPSGGYVYNGQERRPQVQSVSIGSTNLVSPRDYTVSYLNNRNAGTATVRITGAGAYVGLVRDVRFTIVKKEVFISLEEKEVQIDWNPREVILPAVNISATGFYAPDNLNVFTVGGRPYESGDIKLDFSEYGSPIVCQDTSNTECDFGTVIGHNNSPGSYPITFQIDGEFIANNYVAVFDDGLVLLVIDNGGTSIKGKITRDTRYGIRFTQNPAIEKAEMSVMLPASAGSATEIGVVIYDITGNVVWASTGSATGLSWDLRNTAGRIVANGTYLVVVETKDRSGKSYRYSAMLGVRR